MSNSLDWIQADDKSPNVFHNVCSWCDVAPPSEKLLRKGAAVITRWRKGRYTDLKATCRSKFIQSQRLERCLCGWKSKFSKTNRFFLAVVLNRVIISQESEWGWTRGWLHWGSRHWCTQEINLLLAACSCRPAWNVFLFWSQLLVTDAVQQPVKTSCPSEETHQQRRRVNAGM